MPDDIDRAQEINEQHLDDALAAFRLRTRGDLAGERGRTHCEDCDEPISVARRRAMPGCRRCIDCQAEFEAIHTNWRAL